MSVGRPKGLPKTGGRQKGTPNKNTLSFGEGLESEGFNLFKAIVELYNTTQNESIKLSLVELVTKYKHSVPKSVDVPIEPGPEEPSEDEQSDTSELLSLIERK